MPRKLKAGADAAILPADTIAIAAVEAGEAAPLSGPVLDKGVIRLPRSGQRAGAIVLAYLDDSVVGQGEAGSDEVISLAVSELLPESFPCEIRFAEALSQKEAWPSLVFRTQSDLQHAMGAEGISATLTAVFEDMIEFDLQVVRLGTLARPVRLMLNGKQAAEALSVPQEGAAGAPASHKLVFPLTQGIRDGAVIELIDIATDVSIFSRAATWMNLVGAVIRGQRNLAGRLAELEKSHAVLASRLAAMSNNSRERLLLDRLDLFHGLIQSRLDRELAQPVQSFDAAPTLAVSPRIISCDAIEGVGFYPVETEGRDRWSWFGPRPTLILRDVARGCRSLEMKLTHVPAGLNPADIVVTVNTYPVPVSWEATEDGLSLFAVLASAGLADQHGATATLIVNIDFGYSFVPGGGDQRALSVRFESATLSF